MLRLRDDGRWEGRFGHRGKYRTVYGPTRKHAERLMFAAILELDPDAQLEPTPSRGTISRGLRFRVLERCNFTCTYCGARPPDVRLELDHIIPVADGGLTTEENLTVACFDCNAGKGSRRLTPPEDSR